MPLQIRRGTDAERQALSVAPAQGELIWITDDRKLYIGDGTTLAKDLIPVTGYDDNEAKDAAAASFLNGTHDYISFSYNQGPRTIDATVDISNYVGNVSIDGSVIATGTIEAASYKGSVFADDSTLLVNAVDGSINLEGTINTFLTPSVTGELDIGRTTNKFRDLHLSGTIELGSASISSSGTAINLPEGSTVNGIPLASPFEGTDLNNNIIGDDSTVMINTSTEVITAQGGFIGNLTGDVTGNVVGNLLGNVTGNLTGDISGSVFADDSSLMVDAISRRLIGNLTGDVTGSVFGDDSSIILDAIDQKVYASNGFIGDLFFVPEDTVFGLQVLSKQGSTFQVNYYKGTEASPTTFSPGDDVGALAIKAYNGNEYNFAGGLTASLEATADLNGGPDILLASTVTILAGDNTTNGKAATLNSQGTFSAPIFKPGSYANDTARDAAITSPEAGMIIFNQRDDSTGVPVFQGYDGSNWVDLH